MSALTKTSHTKKKSSSKKEDWEKLLETKYDKFGEPAVALRSYRYREALTQQDLADQLGIHRHHISEMENGKRSITKNTAKKLGKFFKVNYRIFL